MRRQALLPIGFALARLGTPAAAFALSLHGPTGSGGPDSGTSTGSGPVSFQVTIPAATSYVLVVNETVANTSGTAYTLDISNAPPPTAVVYQSGAAVRTAEGVIVRWRAGSEVTLLGFNV